MWIGGEEEAVLLGTLLIFFFALWFNSVFCRSRTPEERGRRERENAQCMGMDALLLSKLATGKQLFSVPFKSKAVVEEVLMD